MRIIFEEVDSEYFFEVILTCVDLDRIEMLGGIIGTFVWNGNGIRDVNVYIRKEKEISICHSSKEKDSTIKVISKRKGGKCVLNGPKNDK